MTGIHRHERSNDFVMIHMDLVDRLGSWETAGVLQRLAFRCAPGGGEWTATFAELAAEVRLSEHRLRKAVRQLEDQGYVTRRRAAPYDPTPVWSVVEADPADSGSFRRSDRECEKRDHVPANTGITCPPESPAPPIKKVENLPPTPRGVDEGQVDLFGAPPPAEDPGSGFDAWYAAYPKKAGRKAAERAYLRAVKAGATPDQLLAGLQVQLPAMRQRIADGERQYVKDPATWLNQGCWDDDPPENVHPIRRDAPPSAWGAPVDVGQLPPPRTDPFAVGGW